MTEPKRRIFDQVPHTWRDLQNCVAQVFSEIGCHVVTNAKVDLPRGSVELDVFVRDTTTVPHSNYVCECKNWERRVPKSVVHSFRTVISEIGANRGLLISRRGFQSGAQEAAKFTNIDLLSWREFEDLMFDRWLEGITHRLNPLFVSAHALMDPNDLDLWKMRECTEESHNEWSGICERYPLVTVWALFHWHSHIGLGRIPSLKITDEGVLSKRRTPRALNTYRRIVDAAPLICRSACEELERFWGTSS
jgi:hypothetical protein